jgi:ABC-type lipoprotein release transport system permease subunit
MRAVWARARSELRSSWRSWLVLALLIGIAGGAATAAAAGARRTQSAYPRFLAWANASDVVTGGYSGDRPDGAQVLSTIEHLPVVRRWARSDVVSLAAILPGGRLVTAPELLVTTDLQGALGARIDRFKVLERSEPLDPRSPTQAIIDFGTAERFGLRLGNVIRVVLGRPAEVGNASTAPVRVAAIVAAPGTFPALGGGSGGFPIVYVQPAFAAANHVSVRPSTDASSLSLQLRGGAAAVPELRRELAAALPGSVDLSVRSVQTVGVQRTIRSEAVALWALAVLIALAALAVLGQSVARQTYLDAREFAALRAVGMSRAQLTGLGLLRASAAGIAAAAVTVAVAVALSPLTPIGLARIAEPDPGVAIDLPVLVLGVLGVLLLTPLCSAFAAWRAARLVGAAEPGAVPSNLALAAGRASRSPVAAIGIRMALEPGRGRSAVPVRSAIFGAALAVGALLASMLFWASLRHLLETPLLSGYTWSAFVAPSDAGPSVIQQAVRKDPDVAGSTTGGYANVRIAGASVFAVITDSAGPSNAVVLDGRNPVSADEVALAPASMDATGARIGDTVVISSDDVPEADVRSARYRVVGEAIVPPAPFGPTRPGEGAALTLDGYGRVLGQPITPRVRRRLPSLVTFRPGVDTDTAYDRLRAKLPNTYMVPAARRTDVATLGRIARVPLALSALLALVAIGTLAQTLVTAARRRRRDLAILKTFGFVQRQVRCAVAWQAATLAIAALIVGVPLGIVAGRWAWRGFAEQLGVVPDPVLAWWAWLLIPATLALALIVAAAPAVAAGRTKPAVVLRSE